MNIEETDDETMITIDERLDDATAPELEAIIKQLARKGGLKLVVDLGRTTFTDSSGFMALSAALVALRARNGDMRLARLTGRVLGVFQLIQLQKLFDTHDSLEDAVRSFK